MRYESVAAARLLIRGLHQSFVGTRAQRDLAAETPQHKQRTKVDHAGCEQGPHRESCRVLSIIDDQCGARAAAEENDKGVSTAALPASAIGTSTMLEEGRW
jgi:hypothetical protein